MRRLRRCIAYFRRRTVLDPPLPPSYWQDHWTATAEAHGFVRVQPGTRGHR